MQTPMLIVRACGRAWLAAGLLAAVVASAAAGSGNYLIITAEEYDGSAPLNQFIAAKTARGFDVMTYTAAPGTSRSTIKAYIQSLWGTADAPDYILMVGDTSGSTATATTVPHWQGGGSRHADTDLPYACMDGGDDWHPEIAIGRFSVTSVGMLQDVVDKTLFVEAGDFPDSEYVRRGAFLANSSTYGNAEPTHDWVIENCFEPNDYEAIRIYAVEGGNTVDIMNAVNDGCLWVVYFGHSTSGGWWEPAFYQTHVRVLTNEGLYGLAFGFSCSTARFSLGECFGETWLREANKGAAAYLSASNYIFWGSWQAWQPSVILEKSFFRSFFEDDIWEVGPAWQTALYRFEQEYDGSTDVERNFFEEFVLLGDPSLLLPHTPRVMLVSPSDDLASEGPEGGPFTPDNITYQLTNVSDYAIDYEVTHGSADWVTLSGDLAGTLPPQGTAQVTVEINSNAELLAADTYTDTISFSNTTDHQGDTRRTVTLQIEPIGSALLYRWTLDSDPGWTTQGLWAWGQPTGEGGQSGNPDPTSGYSGDYEYGYNLNGDYENNLTARRLTTTAIDCSGLTRLTLGFWRWLGVGDPAHDHACVQVNRGGVLWQTVWENTTEVTDAAWVYQELNISAMASNQPTVYLRWIMGPADASGQYCGWNIDDVEIWGAAPTTPGDLNGDGCIDQADLGVLLTDWGCTGGDCPGDCDNDGDTDQADLGLLLTNWGAGCP